MKRIMYHDQVMFFPDIQASSNPTNIIYYINKIKKKKSHNPVKDTEKVFYKTQQPFMIKTLSERNREELPQLKKKHVLKLYH